MTQLEAAALVAILVNHYPLAKFTEANAAVYEAKLMPLDARIAQAAVEELTRSSPFLPSPAAIVQEAIRLQRRAAEARYDASVRPGRLLGDGGQGSRVGPSPQAWGGTLGHMLEERARHQRMVEAWCRATGRRVPPDPGAHFVAVAEDGARGVDVVACVRRDVLGYRQRSSE